MEPMIVLSVPGISYGLVSVVRNEDGLVVVSCRCCGESTHGVVGPGRHVETELEHENECLVFKAIRAGEAGRRRRFERMLSRARRAIAMREAAVTN